MFHLANAARPPADVPRRLGHQPSRQPLQSPEDGFQCHRARTRILADFVLLARDCHFIGFEDEDFSTVGGFFLEKATSNIALSIPFS